MKPRVIAFYLPQFHPIKENDEWWGKGFTEWTNVGKAKPLFNGHDQPRVPTELGYYDLRLPEVRKQQTELAKEAGIEGFMYWHYWFGNGKTLMSEIFNDVLQSGEPDFPFCLGWANHSWYSKLWNKDGTSADKLLVEQTYPGEEDIALYFDSLLPAFKDSRYIKIDGKPLFYIFDPIKLPTEYLIRFKELAKDAGLTGIYFVANVVYSNQSKDHFLKRGFDAVTYQRLSAKTPKFTGYSDGLWKIYKLWKIIKGYLTHRPPRMSDYQKCYHDLITEKEKDKDVIPTIVPQWDHTPRSGWNGSLFINSNPEYFKKHALEAFKAISEKDPEHQLVFLKSWNEWGEGNYMEPDLTNGRGYINALKEAINEISKNH